MGCLYLPVPCLLAASCGSMVESLYGVSGVQVSDTKNLVKWQYLGSEVRILGYLDPYAKVAWHGAPKMVF